VSEPKWTKGPWYVRTEDDDWGCDTFVETMDDVLFDVRPAKGPSWQVANARLIAAAPDMAEALKAAIAISDRNVGDGGRTDECQQVYDQCAAALAKARGEA
jgi:hypothetical protein